VELYQLKGFVAVAGEGHLTRAADKLHVSQPALSAQIKALEDELGVTLFERGPSGMALTSAGKRLVTAAHGVIAAANAMAREARTLSGEIAGRIRLGTVAEPEFVRLPALLAMAVERCPLVEIELHHEVSGDAFAKVRDGVLDASYYYGDLAHPAVASMPLLRFAFRVVAPAAWRGRVAGADFAALAREPWILTPPISTHRVLAEGLFREHGVTPATLIEADNEGVIRSLVVAGLGVALMRDGAAAALVESGEACLWEGARLPTELRFIWREEVSGDPASCALLDLVRETWSPEEAGSPPARTQRRLRSA
jgi:DNA-binding transcriptional LysR family regulator